MPLLISYIKTTDRGRIEIGNTVVESEVGFLLMNPHTAILSARHVENREVVGIIPASPSIPAPTPIAKKSHKKKT